MKPNINFSHVAIDLSSAGAVEVGKFKVAAFHDWTEDALKLVPAYLHFPLETTSGGVIGGNMGDCEADLARTGTEYLNVHLVADPANPMTDQQIDAMFDSCLDTLAERFGPQTVIAENVVSRVDGSLSQRRAVEPDAISRALKRSGCGLLLDTAHLRISCLEHGWDWREALHAMPLDRLTEWHVCGCQILPDEQKTRDSMPMTDEDWLVTEEVVRLVESGQAAKPSVVTLEYGGIGPKFDWRTDPSVICTDLNRLHSLITSW